MIYLDHNATTPLKPEVKEVLWDMLGMVGNPSAIHQYGSSMKKKIDDARSIVAKAVNALDAEGVIFTSGATESNATILNCIRGIENVVVSAIEHPSVRKSRDDLIFVPVKPSGIVDLEGLEKILANLDIKDGNTLVSIMMVNNETGILQSIVEIAELVHKYGAIFHTDAVQGLGRFPIDMQEMGIDALTISGHKIGAPQGIGALIIADSKIEITPLLRGGSQERNRRAGTENVAAIVALGKAIELAVKEVDNVNKLRDMRNYLEKKILEISPDTVLFGKDVKRSANTCFFAVSGFDSQAVVIAFDLEGIALSSGTACSSGKISNSTVLDAMGVDLPLQQAAVRVSLGWNTSYNDIDKFLKIWQKIYSRMRKVV